MEIATGLRKTPASQRVHPPGARAWLRKPFTSVSIREIRGLNRRFEDPDWKTATCGKRREQPTEPEVAFPFPCKTHPPGQQTVVWAGG